MRNVQLTLLSERRHKESREVIIPSVLRLGRCILPGDVCLTKRSSINNGTDGGVVTA